MKKVSIFFVLILICKGKENIFISLFQFMRLNNGVGVYEVVENLT